MEAMNGIQETERKVIPMKNQYMLNVLEDVKKRNVGEPEFIQAVTEVFESIEPVIDARPDFVESGIL